jgi:hypothetical protein
MDVKAYMLEDLEFIDGLVKELRNHITKWSSDKVLEKSGDMFDAFYKRFRLEDFLLRHVRPSKDMELSLKKFLKVRNEFRENLESILMLHVDEPDFLMEIGKLHEAVLTHITYLKIDFDPNFFDKISAEQLSSMSLDLEKRIKMQSFL